MSFLKKNSATHQNPDVRFHAQGKLEFMQMARDRKELEHTVAKNI
jgi:hypothetical protein